MPRRLRPSLALLAFLAVPATAAHAAAPDRSGAVYAMTNAAGGNELLVWQRSAQGRLTFGGSYSTGGFGSGGRVDPLASQDSLRLSGDRRWLFAVNAGSDEVSVFRVGARDLELVDREPSGGAFPVSVAERNGRLYALNAGGDGSVAGFTVGGDGALAPIPDSLRSLGLGGTNPPAVGGAPSQIGVSPDGRFLVVIDKGRSRLLVFLLDEDGRPAGEAVASASAGRLPFAFRFTVDGVLVVAEIFGRTTGSDPAGASAASSYVVEADGTLRTVTASLGTGETALCWLDASGRHAWGTNTGSDTLTGFRTSRRGELTLVGGQGVLHAFAGGGRLPLDLAATPDGRFLYTLNVGNGTIGVFRILPSRRLVPLGEAPGLPALEGAQGIAAR